MRQYLELLRELYNAALQNRRDAWRMAHKSISANAQMLELIGVREVRPEFLAIHTHLLQDVITRVKRALDAFFCRCKAGEKPGYPRFKGRGSYHTFTFKDAVNGNGASLVSGGKRVRLSGIGNVRFRKHRPIQGTIKQISVTLSGDGRWYVSFCCDGVPAKPLPATGVDIGIDLGITTFAAMSDGQMVDNPRFLKKERLEMLRSQRRYSNRTKGSHRRLKAVAVYAKRSAHVENCRRNFHYNVAKWLCESFDHIGVEDLNIKGLCKGFLAKQVHDAAWGQFILILVAKAESAGRRVVKVDARGTSQVCSRCGGSVPKTLSERVHRCPHCGYVAPRDINSAQEVFNRMGRILRGEVVDVGLLNDPRSPLLAPS